MILFPLFWHGLHTFQAAELINQQNLNLSWFKWDEKETKKDSVLAVPSHPLQIKALLLVLEINID